MPSVRLPFIAGGALNMANSPVQTGQSEPITGLALPSGLTPGAWFDMTEQEAAAASNAAIDTLHEGRYQWVQFDSGATAAGTTGGLKRGQLLFWKDPPGTPVSIPYPQQWIVTNREQDGSQLEHPAGVILNDATISPVTPGNWFWMQVLAPGRAKIRFRATLTTAATVGATVVAAGAGAGADQALADIITTVAQSEFNLVLGALEGTALPTGGSLALVDIIRANPLGI